MIAEPPVPDGRVCALLFFRGVLPAFEDFAKHDPAARRWIRGLRGEVLFTDREGQRAVLRFGEGAVRWAEAESERPAVIIRLGRRDNVVKLVRGRPAVPFIAPGSWRPVFLFRLARLFLRFQRLLRPRSGDLSDPEFRLSHVRLALAVALFSLAEVAREDPQGRRILGDCPDGTIRFGVEGTDLSASVEKDAGGLRVHRGAVGEAADASVTFASTKVAMEILTRKTDAHGAVALGEVRVDGLVPLADGINHILDRVALYLPA